MAESAADLSAVPFSRVLEEPISGLLDSLDIKLGEDEEKKIVEVGRANTPTIIYHIT